MLILSFLALLPLLLLAAPPPATTDGDISDVVLPATLKKDTFEDHLTEGLHMVEFYLPQCSHCLALEPIWKKVYRDYKSEMERLGIDMLQVNCMEEGDLCDSQSVKYYPNIRIYGPNPGRRGGKVLLSFPLNVKKTEQSLQDFIKDSAYQFGDMDKLNLPSQSRLLDSAQLAELLAGQYPKKQPVLVAFFPSDDKFADINNDHHFASCDNCNEFRNVWNIALNQLVDRIETAHVNCELSPVICKELGFKDLLAGAPHNRSPKVAVIMPRQAGNIIKYTGAIHTGDLVAWTARFLQNYKVEDVNPYDLSQKMRLVNRLINEPKEYMPGERDNRVSFVYYYGNNIGDEQLSTNPTTPEDFEVLPYLLDPVTKLPDVYLYKSNDTGFLKLIERQTKNMLRYIHYNESEPVKEFDKALFVLNTVTLLPTIIGFKDDCLIPYVFQNFDPKDIRNLKLVEAFIRRNSLPFILELTPMTFKNIFNLKNTMIDKVVVALFDNTDPGFLHEALNKLLLAAHDYHYYWSEYFFKQRSKKRTAIAEKGGKSRKKVSRLEDINAMAPGHVVFTYLDLSKFKHLIDEHGWNIDGRENYAKGDAIIIETTGQFYYEHDVFGQPLKNEPWILRNTLMSFHDNSYAVKPLKKNLIGSPYGSLLRPMDFIHQHGFKGYFLAVLVIIVFFLGLKKYARRGLRVGIPQWISGGYSRIGAKNLGILGNIPEGLSSGSKSD